MQPSGSWKVVSMIQGVVRKVPQGITVQWILYFPLCQTSAVFFSTYRCAISLIRLAVSDAFMRNTSDIQWSLGRITVM